MCATDQGLFKYAAMICFSVFLTSLLIKSGNGIKNVDNFCFFFSKGATDFQNLLAIWRKYNGQLQDANVSTNGAVKWAGKVNQLINQGIMGCMLFTYWGYIIGDRA